MTPENLAAATESFLSIFQVPNPLFDLAGIMCGQFAIPFWEFFLATLFGKALIKTHIQVSLLSILLKINIVHPDFAFREFLSAVSSLFVS